MPAYARRWASPMPSINAHGGVKLLPTDRPHQRVPAPAASSRGYRSTGSHPTGGGVPDAPETSPSPPIPGKTPGRACPAPTARRWASPMPSANARGAVKTPPTDRPINECRPLPRGGAGTSTKTEAIPFRDCLGFLYKRLIVPDGFQRADPDRLVRGQDTGYQPHQRGEYQRRQHEPGRMIEMAALPPLSM